MARRAAPVIVPPSDIALALLAGSTELRMACEQRGRPKLLGRASSAGIFLWCRECHCEHFANWSELDAMRSQMRSCCGKLEAPPLTTL